ncbi:MAG: (Fe-S)-binding protein [Bacteroidetes bacterium]|nr:MAG: (Fe-S)-binding protein [Bacteroidota bacterium]
MAELNAQGIVPEVLFWVGCAGSYDARAQKVSRSFAALLNRAGIVFAILGSEESCTGDPARRAGNEFVFQMLAQQNIATLEGYGIKRIVTACPHCFNTLKNEYPALGGNYEVMHHTQFLEALINEGRIEVDGVRDGKVTLHDSCYLGRVNGEYDAPRSILNAINQDLVEMKRSRSKGLCCGAGGAQMFKEDEPGDKRINEERVDEALATGAKKIAVNCPYCLTMLEDGLKARDKQDTVMVYDLTELILNQIH